MLTKRKMSLNPLRWLACLLKCEGLTDAEKRALDTVAIYSAGGMSYERSDEGAEASGASTNPGPTETDRSVRDGWRP